MSCFFNCIPCPRSTGADVSISGKYGNDTKIIGVTRIAVFFVNKICKKRVMSDSDITTNFKLNDLSFYGSL
jgi:hypothetical protein